MSQAEPEGYPDDNEPDDAAAYIEPESQDHLGEEE